MARRCGTGAALFFTALVLAGCALVESVIVFEPAREDAKPVQKSVRTESLPPDEVRCSGCAVAETSQKTQSARYDRGPVLRPIRKGAESNRKPEEHDSMFMKSVKSWLKAGMQLPTWMARD